MVTFRICTSFSFAMPRPTNTKPNSVFSSVTLTTLGGVPDTWMPEMSVARTFSKADILPSFIVLICIPLVITFVEHFSQTKLYASQGSTGICLHWPSSCSELSQSTEYAKGVLQVAP